VPAIAETERRIFQNLWEDGELSDGEDGAVLEPFREYSTSS
jgi:hypothetical protein